jgi:hypothetical protein
VTLADGAAATKVTLRTLMDYLDTLIPEPGSLAMLVVLGAATSRRRRL